MLWWLPDPSSREGLRAQPGLFVLHPWLGAAEARRLAQAISALDGGRLPLLALPYAQLQRVDPALMLQTEAVLLIELPEGATLDPDLAPKAAIPVERVNWMTWTHLHLGSTPAVISPDGSWARRTCL